MDVKDIDTKTAAIAEIMAAIEADEADLSRAIVKSKLLKIKNSIGTIPLELHHIWLEFNYPYQRACVETLVAPTAPYPTWPVIYRNITWIIGDSFTLNKLPIRSHLKLVVRGPIDDPKAD